MQFFSLTRLAVLTLVTLAFGSSSVAHTSDVPPSTQPSSQSPPADPLELQKSQMRDLLEALRSGNTERIKPYLDSLAIPNHQEWFLRVFGPAEGPRLELVYSKIGSQQISWFSKSVVSFSRAGKSSLDVTVWKNSLDAPTELLRIALAAMVVPVSIYEVRASNGPGDKDSRSLGCLVRVDNGFRYLEPDIFRSLSNAPPMRMLQNGNIQEQSLITKVAPHLPEEAKQEHVAGIVTLHIIIATDGSVKKVDVVSGDPVLAKAAEDAVKQWRYKPTLINYIPVEVDTAVHITFGKNE